MTYRLRDGAVDVETAIENHGADPMPVAIGYHPYFRLHAAPRDQWHVHFAAREHMTLNPQLIPTGASKPLAYEDPQTLTAIQLDDVFGNLIRDPDGQARCEDAVERVAGQAGVDERDAGADHAHAGKAPLRPRGVDEEVGVSGVRE